MLLGVKYTSSPFSTAKHFPQLFFLLLFMFLLRFPSPAPLYWLYKSKPAGRLLETAARYRATGLHIDRDTKLNLNHQIKQV